MTMMDKYFSQTVDTVVDDPLTVARDCLPKGMTDRMSGLRVVQGRGQSAAEDSIVRVSEDGTLHVDWTRMSGTPHLFRFRNREFVAVRRERDVLEVYELAK